MNQPAPVDEPAIEAEAATRPARIDIRGGAFTSISGDHAVTLAPATHAVHEWQWYTVTREGAAGLEVGSETAELIVAGVFRMRFENQLGLARLVARDERGSVLDTRHVEVISSKLGGAGQSLRFLRAILADLTSERGAMAFLPRAATSRTVESVLRPPSLLVQYFYLLNNADSIAESLDLILRSPHRVLDDESQRVSIFDLTEVDPDVVLQLVQGGAEWHRATAPPRLRAAPAGVWFRVPREGFDSAENRFVRAVAESLADATGDVVGASWLRETSDPATARRRDTLVRLAGKLRQFGRAPVFDEVGPMQRVPSSSRVLQRRAGYRDLNAHWQAFLQSREPVWRRMQDAIDLRDIAALYEYWVWFALVREIREALGGEPPEIRSFSAAELGLPHGLEARFRSHGTLTYNASRRGYSGIALRPDYLWEPLDGRKVAFDAKFRLAWDAAPLEVDDEDPKDPVAKTKTDDLVKMHAYRDAIPGLRAAVVLYPGHVAEFRTVDKASLGSITVAGVIGGELEGIGAIPMRPEAIEA